jgi:hypothetical protein
MISNHHCSLLCQTPWSVFQDGPDPMSFINVCRGHCFRTTDSLPLTLAVCLPESKLLTLVLQVRLPAVFRPKNLLFYRALSNMALIEWPLSTYEWIRIVQGHNPRTCWFRFLLSDFRRFSASYQKSFQLSLSVLVCYRCLVLIFSLGRSSSPVFRFYFQRILLIRRSPVEGLWKVTGLSPYLALRRDVPFQAQTFFPLASMATNSYPTTPGIRPDSGMGSSLFARRY